MENKTFYTVKEVSSIIGISITSIYEWIRSGRIAAVKIGKFWRISKEELERIVQGGTK